MATNPLPGATFTFAIPLDDLANAGLFKAAPTIAAGDFKRSINNGALTNMDNLPAVTPAGGKLVQFVLSADETTAAGDDGTIDIVGSDASGAEWGDVTVHVRVGTASANVTFWADEAVGDMPATPSDILLTPANKLATLLNGEIVISLDTVVAAYVEGMSPVAQQAVRAAIGMAAASFDTQLAAVAKTGADSDTLETLSDQLDLAAKAGDPMTIARRITP